MLVDTHCHLDFHQFDNDLEDVISRAYDEKINTIINPGINIRNSQSAIKLAESYKQVYAAVGVHPNEAHSWNSADGYHIKEIAKTQKVIAIGEIGLDYYRDSTPYKIQKEVFQNQLEIAADLELPVIIHSRSASQNDQKVFAELLGILDSWTSKLEQEDSPLANRPGVLHSYSGTLDMAMRAIKMNFFIGVTGPVTFRNARKLQNMISSIPIEFILTETDAPFLTPHPYRGKRNEPKHVKLIAEKIAELHQLSFQDVESTTYKNAQRLFAWQVTN